MGEGVALQQKLSTERPDRSVGVLNNGEVLSGFIDSCMI